MTKVIRIDHKKKKKISMIHEFQAVIFFSNIQQPYTSQQILNSSQNLRLTQNTPPSLKCHIFFHFPGSHRLYTQFYFYFASVYSCQYFVAYNYPENIFRRDHCLCLCLIFFCVHGELLLVGQNLLILKRNFKTGNINIRVRVRPR